MLLHLPLASFSLEGVGFHRARWPLRENPQSLTLILTSQTISHVRTLGCEEWLVNAEFDLKCIADTKENFELSLTFYVI